LLIEMFGSDVRKVGESEKDGLGRERVKRRKNPAPVVRQK
jgi:hypothetical protein